MPHHTLGQLPCKAVQNYSALPKGRAKHYHPSNWSWHQREENIKTKNTPSASKLGLPTERTPDNEGTFQDPAFSLNREIPVHRWVPWVAGYSKIFAADAIEKYAREPRCVVLDPFAGVGTTLLEADRLGHRAIGYEINPYATFVASIKLKAHRIDTGLLRDTIARLEAFGRLIGSDAIEPEANPPRGFISRAPFYSPNVERKVLFMMDFIENERKTNPDGADAVRLAFGSTMVGYSNYSYEPSLGQKRTVGRAEVDDYPVIEAIAQKMNEMAEDADWYRLNRADGEREDPEIRQSSFLDTYDRLPRNEIHVIVTSPPYMNNYHYNRNTRPQMYWLGLCESPRDLRVLETLNFGTYWQNARDKDEILLNDQITDPEIRMTVDEIRRQNPEKGKKRWERLGQLRDCVPQ